MSEEQTITYNLQVNAEQVYREVDRLSDELYTVLSLVRRLSGDERLDDAVRKIEVAIAALQAFQAMYLAIETGTGFGVLRAGMRIGIAVGTAVNVMYDVRR